MHPKQSAGDYHFDGWKAPRTPAGWDLVDDIQADLLAYERDHRPRRKARKAVDVITLRATLAAVVCNLVHLNLIAPAGAGLAVPRSKGVLSRASRYRAPAINKTLPRVLDALEAMGLIEQGLGSYVVGGPKSRTTIHPTPGFIARAEAAAVDLDDLGRRPGEEVIILRSVKDDDRPKGEWREYADTAETGRWRTEVQDINRWLDQASIGFSWPAEVDLRDRFMRRRFTNDSFASGGRLYGGFWMNMRSERRAGILINGKPVVELDYGQMGLRLLYARIGDVPPGGDLYALPGADPARRDGVKKLVNALLFTTKPLTKRPKGTRQLLGDEWPLRRWVQAVVEAHPRIAAQFNQGVGHQTQHTESEVLIAVLLALMGRGIVALPIHDSIIVPADAADDAREIMEALFTDIVGLPAVVRMKGTRSDLPLPDQLGTDRREGEEEDGEEGRATDPMEHTSPISGGKPNRDHMGGP